MYSVDIVLTGNCFQHQIYPRYIYQPETEGEKRGLVQSSRKPTSWGLRLWKNLLVCVWHLHQSGTCVSLTDRSICEPGYANWKVFKKPLLLYRMGSNDMLTIISLKKCSTAYSVGVPMLVFCVSLIRDLIRSREVQCITVEKGKVKNLRNSL